MENKIRNEFLTNERLSKWVKPENIFFYEWTDEQRVSYPFILIAPVNAPMSGVHSSDQELSKQLTFDLHVQADDIQTVKNIMIEIHPIMKRLKFAQLPGGLNDYLDSVDKYVQVRRYRINTDLHDTKY